MGDGRQDARARHDPILRVVEVKTHFVSMSGLPLMRRRSVLQALDGVSFDLYPGETLGVVGESGSGKSTLARTLMMLERPTSGQAFYGQENIFEMPPARLRELRREMQMVFQDPWSSLNPRMPVKSIIGEGWIVHPGIVPRQDWRRRVQELMELVGLNADWIDRYPSQFSGGQRQRIAIARALAVNPKILILDEAVSALDVSIQAQVINLLEDIQCRLGIAYIFIAHDLSVVQHLSHRVAVMYLGRLMEIGDEGAIYDRPSHPYTQALLSAVPENRPGQSHDGRIILEGEIPNPSAPPSGCRFRTRCWRAERRCAEESPALQSVAVDRTQMVACHFPDVSVVGEALALQ